MIRLKYQDSLVLTLLTSAIMFKFYHKFLFLSSTFLIIISILVYFIFNFFKKYNYTINKKNILFYLYSFSFLTLLIFSLWWTSAEKYPIVKISYFTLWFVSFMVFSDIILKNTKKFITLNFFFGFVYILFISIDFGSIFSLLSHITKFSRLGHSDDNLTNPIIVARYLGFFLINTIFISLIYKNLYIKFISYFIVLSILFLIILTGSKGILLSLSILVLLIVIKIKINTLIKITGIIMISLIIWYLFFNLEGILLNNKFYSFIEYRFLNTHHSSYGTREQQYLFAINGFLNASTFHQLFGMGIGNYGYAYLGSDVRYYPHNIFLEILYENGLIGIFFLLIMLYFMLKEYFKINIYKDYFALYYLICFIYFFINAMVSGDIYENIFIFLFTLLLYKHLQSRKV